MRVPVDTVAFVSYYFFPPILGHFVVAVLAVTPQTHTLRVALLPVVTALALRAVASLDWSVGDNLDRTYTNTQSVFLMILIVTRTLDWTLTKEPLTRYLRPGKGSQSTIMDALDLVLTFRGHGWDWSRGVHIPRETRPMGRRGFTFYVILSAAVHTLVHGVVYTSIRAFLPTEIGATGGSIFDETLPFHVRYLRASVISALALIRAYTLVQACYDTCTLVAVLVFGQEPQQWPPAFDAPWRATSMSNFWGRRWHQFLRRTFLIQGGYPLSFLFGRVGLIVGAFLASGVVHLIAMVTLNNRLGFWRMTIGFGMMAPVILAETAFKQLTGRKVGGLAGWIWTMAWLIVWGNILIDEFAMAGVFGSSSSTDLVGPGWDLVVDLVARFDSWLHAM